MKFKIIKFKNVNSTNDVAIRLIKKKKIKPSIILTNNQKKGKGTMGKKWVSKKGNIFLTIFFDLKNKKIKLNQFSALNPYIIKKVLTKYSKFKIIIKWPNDLMIKKKKICGILQEVIEANSKKYLIIGVGINTTNAPSNKSFKSISLSQCTNKVIQNSQIINDIKNSYENFLSDINKHTFLNLKKKYLKS